jgi:hypothetical protein
VSLLSEEGLPDLEIALGFIVIPTLALHEELHSQLHRACVLHRKGGQQTLSCRLLLCSCQLQHESFFGCKLRRIHRYLDFGGGLDEIAGVKIDQEPDN